MKIKSNIAFDCYETAYESWSGGKDITLDGIRLVPVTILDKIKDEIEQIEINGHIKDAECFIAGLNTASKIIDKYRESEARE